MSEIRLARAGETVRQKEIWKLCFKDTDQYIDFFYANRYYKQDTMVLIEDEVIVSMLTMMPVKIVTFNKNYYNAAMLYAIATHPQYQHRGFAAGLINFTCQYLNKKGSPLTMLVPSDASLFEFYLRLGYQDGFFIREVMLTRLQIKNLSAVGNNIGSIRVIQPEDYNQRRNRGLSGQLYVSYSDREAIYQDKLSLQSGAGIYGLQIKTDYGCAAIERINADKIIIKELLIPDQHLLTAIKLIADEVPAEEYIVRTPAFCGQPAGGLVRPFGMIRAYQEHLLTVLPEDLGYLGLAFD